MVEKYKYRAFISYCHADEKWARWLHKALETYRTPRRLTVGGPSSHTTLPKRLTPIFRDREDLATSPDLPQRLNAALEQSENLIVICSPKAANSHWVSMEVRTFKRLGRSQRVFCLIVDGDPAASGTENDCFPSSVRERYDDCGVLLDRSAEPVGADVRPEGDGKQLAKLKLIAGLLDVELDKLRQRETQRRQRRLIGIAATSTVAAALTATLAIDAVVARHEADQRRQQAEDLLEFMVGDLRESLAPLGRLDLLESVGRRAMNYYQAVDLDLLSDSELLHQTRIITQIGEIRFEQLEYARALTSFQDSYQRSVMLLTMAPNDGARLYNRAQSEFWVGYVYWMKGDLTEAADWLNRYLQSGLQLEALNPENQDWLMEVAYGHHNLGALARERDQLEMAEDHFKATLEVYDRVHAADPERDLDSPTADLISYLGDIALMRGDLRQSLDYYQRSADIYRSHSAKAPGDMERRYFLANAITFVGDGFFFLGEIAKADSKLREAHTIYQQLTSTDPSNISWRSHAAQLNVARAQLLYAQANWRGAKSILVTVFESLNVLLQDNHEDRYVRGTAASAWKLQARIDLQLGNPEVALQSAASAKAHFQAMIDSGMSGSVFQGRHADLYILEARAHRAMANPDLARQSIQLAIDSLGESPGSSSLHYVLDPLARCLAFTDRENDSRAVMNSLIERGYKPVDPWPEL